MIGPTGTVRVMVATKPVDFRKGMEGLAALVREAMGADPFCGTVYVFRAKRADRIKIVLWDGTVKAVEPVPYVIDGAFTPRLIRGDRAQGILADLWGSSRGPFAR